MTLLRIVLICSMASPADAGRWPWDDGKWPWDHEPSPAETGPKDVMNKYFLAVADQQAKTQLDLKAAELTPVKADSDKATIKAKAGVVSIKLNSQLQVSSKSTPVETDAVEEEPPQAEAEKSKPKKVKTKGGVVDIKLNSQLQVAAQPSHASPADQSVGEDIESWRGRVPPGPTS